MSPTKSSIGFAWTMMLHPWTQVGGDSTAGLVLKHTVQTHTVEVGVHFGTKFELVCEHFTCTYANRMSECGGGSGYAFWYQIDVPRPRWYQIRARSSRAANVLHRGTQQLRYCTFETLIQ